MEASLVDAVRSLSGHLFGGWLEPGARPLLRFVHVAAFLVWAGPAMGASWFVYAAAWARRHEREDEELLRRERWVRRQFNFVVAAEHLGFGVLVVSGMMLAETTDWAYAGQSWFAWKLVLVFLIFVPMELLDVVLSAWLQRLMKPGSPLDPAAYARAARVQDLFLRATIPPVLIGIPVVLYLAVVKPL